MTRFSDHVAIVDEHVDYYELMRPDHITFHSLKDFCESPAAWKANRDNPKPRAVKGSFIFGSAAHCAILEGSRVFEERYEVGGPVNPNTGKSYGLDSQKFAKWAEGKKHAVTPEARLDIRAMFDAAYDDPRAFELLRGIRPEVTVRGGFKGFAVQGRLDGISTGEWIVDLKTIDDINFAEAHIERYLYTWQMSFYRRLLSIATGRKHGASLIFVGKPRQLKDGTRTKPEVKVIDLSEDELNKFDELTDVAFKVLRRCFDTDNWPVGPVDLYREKWAA